MKIRLLMAFLLVSAAASAWMDPSWQYRAPMAVNNSGSALSDYQVAVNTTNLVYNNTGLVGSWHLSEGAGTRAADSSGSSNDGTLVSSPAWVDGKFGKALQFSGSNYVDIPDSPSNSITGAITVEAWVKWNSGATVISKPTLDQSGAWPAYVLYINPPDGRPVFLVAQGTSGAEGVAATSGISAGTWAHLVATWGGSGTQYKIYINGVLNNSASSSFSSLYDSGLSLQIGRWRPSDPNYFNGIVDEVRLYNRALSPQEIQAHYNASKLRPDYADLRFSQPYTLYETPISISGTGTDLTDYQVSINITNPAVLSHMRADGSDLRFFGTQTSTPYSQTGLPYWIESINSSIAKIWVKTNVSSAGSTIYIYYGNPSAGSVSNYFNAFDALGDGSSGALTVSSASTIVNTYAYLTGNESAGDGTIAINNGTGFSNGDEILIIQMQNYSGGTAGTYEFRRISSGGGTASLTLNAPLKNSYASGTFDSINATVTQLVRIPQYTNVTINNGASITAASWNGYSGGIVAFKANGTVTIVSGGTITATAKGFRTSPGCCVAIGYINGNGSEGYTGKGDYDQLATLGGGGAGKLCANSNTAGGGGGSYATAGTAGYIQGSCTAGAGSTTIFGSPDLKILLFGGAGGVGYAGPSSNGGGIILILANNLNNSGTITAQGGDGGQVIAPSGAGAGGSISIIASTLTTGNNVIATAGASAIAGAGAGGNGRIRLSYNSIIGTSNPVAYTTGFDTEHNRKYASPEPSATVGAESVKSTPEALLSYWQESDSRAWVKVPSLPANSNSSVFMYYGNPAANSTGNATATFDFFDDFNDNDISDWTAMPSTGYGGSGADAQSGQIHVGGTSTSTGSRKAFSASSAVWEATLKRTGQMNDGRYGKTMLALMFNGVGNYWPLDGYAVQLDTQSDSGTPLPNSINLVRIDATGAFTNIVGTANNWNPPDANPHNIKVTRSPANLFELFVDGVSKGTATDSTYSSLPYMGFWGIAGGGSSQKDFWMDFVRVRKYASPEPALSLQQEEVQSPALFIGVSPASKATFPNYNETFSLWAYNNQTAPDTFTLSCAGACSVFPASLPLTPYQNGSATVTVTSANVSGTTQYTITATSQANSSNIAAVSASLTVDATKWRSTWTDAYNNGFRYRIPIAVSNNGSALTDYQINITIDAASPINAGKMRSDCGDLRFTNGTNEMPYWIESGCNTTSTKIWVKVLNLPAGNSTVYVYYGNPSMAGAGSFSSAFIRPDSIAGLKLWLKADAITGLLNNDQVGTWADSSGNGKNAVQGTAGNKPLYKTNVANGMPAVQFDGVDDWLSTTAIGAGYTPEVFIVINVITYGAAGIAYSSPQNGYGAGTYAAGSGNFGSAATSGALLVSRPLALGAWGVVRNFFGRDLGAGASQFAVNGGQSAYTTSSGTYSAASLDNIDIGRYPAASHYQNAYIAEVIVYSGPLSDADRKSIERNLAAKYGIVLAGYHLPQPTVSAGAEQARGYRTLVRRCGQKQENASVSAYYSSNSTYAGSCLSNQYGICSLEISAGTYDLRFLFTDNSTAWKNGTVFG